MRDRFWWHHQQGESPATNNDMRDRFWWHHQQGESPATNNDTRDRFWWHHKKGESPATNNDSQGIIGSTTHDNALMRIVAGAWRGRKLVAPPGQGTRPTADRVRQALFDMLAHAPWGGRAVIEGVTVLDAFAGTGALGLEALSRGAATACFIEQDATALRALRANVLACGAGRRVEVMAADVLSAFGRGQAGSAGRTARGDLAISGSATVASLVFLDPPYGQNLVPRAIGHLRRVGRLAPGAVVVAEIGRSDLLGSEQKLLAEREHGAARIVILRAA